MNISIKVFLIFVFPAFAIGAETFQSFSNAIRPFVSDGCSGFPDSFGSYNWQRCCVEHDYAYWKGGVEADRSFADEELNQCVSDVTFGFFGNLVELGTMIGGRAELPTSWHWGYGWKLKRDYKSLGEYELQQIEKVTPELPDEIDVEWVDVIPKRFSVTGDYCLDIALDKILDDQDASQIEYQVLGEKLLGSPEGDLLTLEIATKTCEKPYKAQFLLLTRDACKAKTNEIFARGRVRLQYIDKCSEL